MAKTSLPVRIGIHVSSAGGVDKAAERAHDLGCDTFQVFTSSPRQWKPYTIPPEVAPALARHREAFHLAPLVVHANYLINLAGVKPDFHALSCQAIRGELERARNLSAEYLVMHPGSASGSTPEAAVEKLATTLREVTKDFDWGPLSLLIENTAGGGGHLGGAFVEVAAILDRLPGLPVAACIDTCHCWVAGYDMQTPAGIDATLRELDQTVGLARVPVFHVNDAKAARGSHLDRHQHIGEGQIGADGFAHLLRHPSLRGKAFIAETPVDDPGDLARNLATLRRLAG